MSLGIGGDWHLIRGAMTVISFLTFCGLMAWAYSKGSRKNFDQASQLPLDDDFDVEQFGERKRVNK